MVADLRLDHAADWSSLIRSAQKSGGSEKILRTIDGHICKPRTRAFLPGALEDSADRRVTFCLLVASHTRPNAIQPSRARVSGVIAVPWGASLLGEGAVLRYRRVYSGPLTRLITSSY